MVDPGHKLLPEGTGPTSYATTVKNPGIIKTSVLSTFVRCQTRTLSKLLLNAHAAVKLDIRHEIAGISKATTKNPKLQEIL